MGRRAGVGEGGVGEGGGGKNELDESTLFSLTRKTKSLETVISAGVAPKMLKSNF